MWRDEQNPSLIRIRADSDAFIVRGLISVLMILFDGKTADEITTADVKSVFSKLGLDQHLSPTRKNGLFAMTERIRTLARGLAQTQNVANN
jgi:sulfur transfer protein SufE